jgi:hypothetical protein
MRWRRTVTALLLGLALAATANADLAKRVPLEPSRVLRIELERGNVEVLTHRDADVRVEARARGVGASSIHFELASHEGGLVLTGRADPWVDWMRSGPRIAVRVWVPEDCGVAVHTASGDVEIEGVAGPVVATTSGGTIRIIDLAGSAQMVTGAERISLSQASGGATAYASSASSGSDGVSGHVEALTDRSLLAPFSDAPAGPVASRLLPVRFDAR